MKKTCLLLALCCGIVGAMPCMAEVDNLNTSSVLLDEGIEPTPAPTQILDGIPLMPGLQPATDKDLIRILPAPGKQPYVAIGIVDVDDVYNFYKRELPPLGWALSHSRDYTRGAETLHIDVHGDGKLTTVTFTASNNP